MEKVKVLKILIYVISGVIILLLGITASLYFWGDTEKQITDESKIDKEKPVVIESKVEPKIESVEK